MCGVRKRPALHRNTERETPPKSMKIRSKYLLEIMSKGTSVLIFFSTQKKPIAMKQVHPGTFLNLLLYLLTTDNCSSSLIFASQTLIVEIRVNSFPFSVSLSPRCSSPPFWLPVFHASVLGFCLLKPAAETKNFTLFLPSH